MIIKLTLPPKNSLDNLKARLEANLLLTMIDKCYKYNPYIYFIIRCLIYSMSLKRVKNKDIVN